MKRKLSLLLIVVLSTIQLTACGGGSMYQSGRDGYTSITAVDGVTFDLVSSVVRNATAITNISEEMEFEPDCTYLYKDGESSYFLFNIRSIVCIVQKGTNFGFYEAQDKLSALKEGNILGVYLTSPYKKKLEYEDSKDNGYYKMIATATAQVSLTSELYNDFAGKLAVIYDGTTEWSFFIGSIGSDYDELDKDIRESMSYMAATFAPYQRPAQPEATQPPVSMGGENESPSPEVSTSPEASTSPETKESAMPSETPEETADSEEENEETAVEVEIEEPVPTAEPESGEAETEPEEAEPTEIPAEEETVEVEVAEEEQRPTMEPTPEPTPTPAPTPIVTEDGRTTIVLNNQKNTVKEDTKVYLANIYDMLPIGKMGYASIYTGKEYENAVVKADEIYTGNEALQIIKKAYQNGTLKDQYFDPPPGCSWHVVHYTADFSGCSKPGYLNVKLRGMDGENLRFRGIEYPQRTYDIPVSETEFYSFYAVPNACPEYALEIGEGDVDHPERAAAYYLAKLTKGNIETK